MDRFILVIGLIFLLSGVPIYGLFALTDKDIIRLKNAGVKDKTIQMMVTEKSHETCALTVSEVLALKKSGISEGTIQILIKEGSFLKNSKPIIYGKDLRPIQFMTAEDLVQLKASGLSDEVLQAIIVFGSKDADEEARQRAWEMLENMNIKIEMGEKN